MTDFVLTMLDTTGIQHYIFNSNRLQENIGASELVYRATTLWAYDALEAAGLSHNFQYPGEPVQRYQPGFQIENEKGKAAEVVFAGGGNMLLIFQSLDDAQSFTRHLTRRLLIEAPGLAVAVQHLPFNWGKNELEEKRLELIRRLAAHKQSRLPSMPLLGLSVSAVCQSTGLPAVKLVHETDDPTSALRRVSRETAAKLDATKAANKRLKDLLGQETDGYQFPFQIDNLGRLQGEESYVAVVHADGNQMGEHVKNATQNQPDERAFIETLREFSIKVNAASLATLKDVVRRVVQATKDGSVPTTGKNLPFRPLVFGGDDVTFLCNGQIGVSLAAAYLGAFEHEMNSQGLQKMYACAGVAIVKMHYPFARAYALSEDLAKNAKKFVRRETTEKDCSALDWHYATGGLSGDLGVIRAREYTTSEGLLNMRPVRLNTQAGDSRGRAWRGGLEDVIVAFQHGPDWAKKHNKVIGLREPLRKGSDAVRTYLTNFELGQLPSLGSPEAANSGWQDDKKWDEKEGKELDIRRCVYFDVVELFDQYIPLPTQEVKA
jgi:hypothetical protein